MTRCPNCGTDTPEPTHVVIHDPSLPEGQYRTETDYPLHDGRVLKLRLGRGRIVEDTPDLTHRPGRAL